MAGHEVRHEVLLLSRGGRRLAETSAGSSRSSRSAASASAAGSPGRRAPGPPSAVRPCDAGPAPRCTPALRRARSMRTPGGHEDLLHAGLLPRDAHQTPSAARGPCPAGGRSSGTRQLVRRQRRRISGRVQFIWYMLAVGPPRSLTTPENSGSARHAADLVEHRLPAAALNDPALVRRQRTERAAAETAAENLDRVFHHLVGRNPLPAVARGADAA